MNQLLSGWSKKLTAFLIYAATLLLNRKFNLGLEANELYALTGSFGAYTLSQGIADFGKGRAQAEAKERATR